MRNIQFRLASLVENVNFFGIVWISRIPFKEVLHVVSSIYDPKAVVALGIYVELIYKLA